MGMSNAEKQARWRARREAQLKAERDALTAEIAALRERLHNRPAEPKAATAGEDQAYLNRLATAAGLAEALADPANRQDTLRERC